MARERRFALAGIPQHVVQRGNNRDPCFYTVMDYQRYLQDLRDAAERDDVAIHAYVLITNHVHLLATTSNPFGVTYMMQDFSRMYVRYINRDCYCNETFWEGRFKSC